MASPRVGYGVFQSTHPSGVRRPPSRRPASDVYFNPRTPVGCDHDYQGLLPCVGYFNPRTPVGCDDTRAPTECCMTYFNPRTPVGCDVSADTGTPVSMNFNPRTPVGCDIVGDDVVPDALISIHAPQWGATRGRWRRSNAIRFQSTHPSGVRRAMEFRTPLTDVISIHAPQWGATPRATPRQWSTPDFNPRTPVGCDRGRYGLVCPSAIFQSTHPSGVRPAEMGPRPRNLPDFNPRTPVGCDGSRSSWP